LSEYCGADGDAEFPVPGSAHPMGIGYWLPLSPWNNQSIWSCLANWGEHELPSRLVPFGEDGGGNLVCFDYRVSDSPSIALWFHELSGDESIWRIAANFDDFLNSLSEPGPYE